MYVYGWILSPVRSLLSFGSALACLRHVQDVEEVAETHQNDREEKGRCVQRKEHAERDEEQHEHHDRDADVERGVKHRTHVLAPAAT